MFEFSSYVWWNWVILVVVAIIAISIFFGFFVTTQQKSKKIIQRFGKFIKTTDPGLSVKWPIIDQVAGEISLKTQQLNVEVETKTKDNVFTKIIVSVQYFVDPMKVEDAFYRLEDPKKQITSYVFDVVRAKVPGTNLDDLFLNKDEIADAVKAELSTTMTEFGYSILKALVTDIAPDETVKEAMNAINAAQRNRVAATEKGEADKILLVKAAEAEAESKALQGKGIADQRKAIIEGLKNSIEDFKQSVPGATPQDVMNLVLMTQYLDTMKGMADNSKTNTIFMAHSPAALSDLSEQIKTSMLSADAASTKN